MSHSEWDLLANSEDINKSDWVEVESDDGTTSKLQYIKKSKDSITLRDKSGESFQFSQDSLEELDGYRIIIGKA